jgi:drug/metabolite transporter (DMT)-like permease
VASRGNPGELAALAVNRGDLLMLIACFFYAAYSIGLTRRPNVSALALFAIMGTVAWLVSLPLVAVETWQQGWTPPSAMGWFLVMLVTLLPSFVAQISFIHGVALIGPGRAGVFVNLVPVFASIMAVIFLQEVFELYHALALALVLGGIWLSEIGKTTRTPSRRHAGRRSRSARKTGCPGPSCRCRREYPGFPGRPAAARTR